MVFLEFDLAGAEWFITGFAAGEPAMIKTFKEGLDPHSMTASLMFGCTYEEAKADPEGLRQNGKRCNHSLNYGLGYKQFGMRYEMPETEAKRLRNLYHGEAYPRVSAGLYDTKARNTDPTSGYWPWVREEIKRNGCLVNCFGRRRDFYGTPGPELWLDAYAHIPQSTVADIIRLGMVHAYRHEPQAELVAQDHDSITVQVKAEPSLIAEVTERIVGALSPELHYGGESFRLRADVSMGFNRNKRTMAKGSTDPEKCKAALEWLRNANAERSCG